ncbi:hypothetical protein [Spongiimicrobium sp. 3-5]|uniref:hypothetical protein n=1 Tax=Spongiimicrobium sp. 3-5 TaxID=3332596 RepID=UPI003980FA3C
MKFKLVPILDRMEDLYKSPRTHERFERYLFMLQGKEKGEMVLPIAGYNPMGKANVLLKIRELKKLQAELLIEETLQKINNDVKGKVNREIEVVINLADDVGGAWSNLYTTDFSSKFDITALLKRNFCTPYYWTSENYTEELIVRRAKEYVFRTLFRENNGNPKSLKDHLLQEVFVQDKCNNKENRYVHGITHTKIEKFYLEHAKSKDYNLIFNFFYGDEASRSLEYACWGIKRFAGFEYAKYVSKSEKDLTF